MHRGDFLVFTSRDIRLLDWLKRKHHWAYHFLMKQAQKLFATRRKAMNRE
ncbi:MAG: hypothetical protein ACLFPD_02610 [Desulfosudaceae bacterium]